MPIAKTGPLRAEIDASFGGATSPSLGSSDQMPDLSGILGSGQLGVDQLLDAAWPKAAAGTSLVANRLQTAAILTNIGLPQKFFGSAMNLALDADIDVKFDNRFGELAEKGVSGGARDGAFPSGFSSLLGTTFEEISFGPIMNSLSRFSQTAVSFVPFLNGAVSIIQGLISLGKHFGGESDPDPVQIYEDARFHPEVDALVGNAMISRMRIKKDWTPIFSPIGNNVDEPVQLESGGMRWGPRGGHVKIDRGWSGVIPIENGNFDRGWEISKEGTAVNGTRSLGQLLPTGANIGDKLWGMVSKPGSPSMFTVDTHRARERWFEYLMEFRAKLLRWSYHDKDATKAFIDGLGRRVYGWSQYRSWDAEADAVGFNKSPEMYFGLSSSFPAKGLMDLYQLQLGSLDTTVVCAYIDESFPAISGDATLNQKWRNNRDLLLNHQARCEVDVDSIPDVGYRTAMIAAKADFDCPPPGTPFTQRFSPMGNEKIPPARVSPSKILVGGIGHAGVSSGGSGAGLLIMAAAMGLLIMKGKSR
jgi:hypothetical protein